MRAAWRHAWRFLGQSWRLVLGCFAVSAATGAAALVLCWLWLDGVLDASLPSRTWVTEIDPQDWLDLLVHQGNSVGALVYALAGLAAFTLVAATWVNGVMAAAVSAAHEGHGVGPWRLASTALPRLLRLAAGVWIAQAVLVIVTALATRRAVGRWSDGTSELTINMTWLVGLGIGGAFALALTLLHDHARLRLISSDRRTLGATAWALRFLRHHGGRAGLLLLLWLGLGAGVASLHWVVAAQMATTSGPGMASWLAWGQLSLFGRVALRAALYAAEWRLQMQFDRAQG